MWGAASILFCCARCPGTPVWARGSRSSRRSPHRVAPPAPGGAEGRARGSPAGGGCGGGGGECGGPSGPLAMPPDGRGGRGGGMAVLAPGASRRLGGRTLPPPPSTLSRILVQALAGAPHPPGRCRAALTGRGRP